MLRGSTSVSVVDGKIKSTSESSRKKLLKKQILIVDREIEKTRKCKLLHEKKYYISDS
jgi:hypothetical protein